jgi:stage V sporulation protein SpoVS
MAFKALLMAHAPDADPAKHRTAIDTGQYQLYTVAVKSQAEAIAVCREFVAEKGIDSVMLCPGFTHRDVAGIAEAVGENVGVTVARGDGPSNRVSQAALRRAGFIPGT